MKETAVLWVTKYALTKGVQARRCEISAGYAYSDDTFHIQYPPGHWHRSKGAAIARAEEMRTGKLKSLEKQLAKVRAMRFEP